MISDDFVLIAPEPVFSVDVVLPAPETVISVDVLHVIGTIFIIVGVILLERCKRNKNANKIQAAGAG